MDMNVIDQLNERRDQARLGGGEKRIASQHAIGKLTARERIELLLDDGSFEEFDTFVAHRCTDFGMEKQRPPGDGVVTGWARSMGAWSTCFPRISPFLGAALAKPTRKRFAKSWIWRCKMVRR